MASFKRNKSGGTQPEGLSNTLSPASSVAISNPSSIQGLNNNAPKYGTVVPNRIFVGGISSSTTEAELTQLFSKYGTVKATKIIADRAGVSKGYGFVTFDNEDEVKCLIQDSNNVVFKERRLNIAPAVKKQPPFCKPFDTSSPPPPTSNLYYHNGVPYTFHNGMAFFLPSPHQPTITTLQATESTMYQTYASSPNTPPAPYGPVLVPAPPLYLPPNTPFLPLPIANGTPYIYSGSGSATGNSGSPIAGTPDSAYMQNPVTPQYFAQQYPTAETAFYPPPMIVYNYNTDYEIVEQQPIEGRSSTATTPHSDISDRSSNQSFCTIPLNAQFKNRDYSCMRHSESQSTPQAVANTPIKQTNPDSQVPVVSWKNHAEERELHIRDGRRAFYPAPPPPPPPPSSRAPSVLFYQQSMIQSSYSARMFSTSKSNQMSENYYNQRQNSRGRQRSTFSSNTIPFIPKFPDHFNNNNPLALNNNFHDKKMGDLSNGKPQKYISNRIRVGGNRGNHNVSPPPSKMNTSMSIPSQSYPSLQIVQQPQNHHYERQYVPAASNTGMRWTPHQQVMAKRLPFNKRQNGSSQNNAMTPTTNNIRLAKKSQSEGDLGGGGDAQPIIEFTLTPPGSPTVEATSKMQSLSLEANN